MPMNHTPVISRPVVSIEHNSNGGSTYSVTAEHWKVEYVRLGWSQNEKATKLLGKGFGKEFDRQAKDIEEGKVRPHPIMRTFVDNGFFRVRTKMQDTTNVF